ncbi:MAG: acyl-CoA dehydrogenase family protein [Candidatus Hydrogenedentes bacterium]|nr:acyl-CoA dehydrogenase family protein [Candidatus Hydrogenedentota bacterium]
MPKAFFEEEHKMFRESVRRFCETEIVPYHAQWEKDGQVSREVWRKAGENGFLCMQAPEAYGGIGLNDFRYNQILGEELIRVGAHGPGFSLQNDIILPYILNYGTEEQKRSMLPGMISGEMIVAIAMSEPNTGSDLAGIQTTAKKMGDRYLINGQKTFITNGILSDVVIVVCKTDLEAGHAGTSLILVEKSREGFAPPRKLEKMGMAAQDTSELFFENVEVPVSNLLGTENHGFFHLMTQLPQERLSIACVAVAACECALEMTVKYCHERKAFGREIGKFQHNRFTLAEMKTETEIARVFLNHCVELLNEGELSTEKAAMAKWWTTELQKKVIDQCVQLHGGYGYMMEYPIAKAYIDSRAQTIYAGTTEIMKEIIGRAMGF